MSIKILSKNLSVCLGGTESPARDLEYFIIVSVMSPMVSRFLRSTLFFVFSLRTSSAVLAVPTSWMSGRWSKLHRIDGHHDHQDQ